MLWNFDISIFQVIYANINLNYIWKAKHELGPHFAMDIYESKIELNHLLFAKVMLVNFWCRCEQNLNITFSHFVYKCFFFFFTTKTL